MQVTFSSINDMMYVILILLKNCKINLLQYFESQSKRNKVLHISNFSQ